MEKNIGKGNGSAGGYVILKGGRDWWVSLKRRHLIKDLKVVSE